MLRMGKELSYCTKKYCMFHFISCQGGLGCGRDHSLPVFSSIFLCTLAGGYNRKRAEKHFFGSVTARIVI